MPAETKTTKAPVKRWKQPTRQFVQFWNSAINRDEENDWEAFCMRCWAAFTTDPDIALHNKAVHEAAGLDVDDLDAVYLFISQKCYAKAINLRARLRKAGKEVPLPNGWRSRPRKNPRKTEERLDILEIAALFTV